MARTVAVTGATGFIGRHLVRRFGDDGWRVRALARRLPAPPLGGPAVEVIHGSLDDPASLRRLVQGADAVVHAAGLVKARSRTEFFRVNADGTARLVEAAAAAPVPPRFVLLSSLAARQPQLSAYAASKRAGEAALVRAGSSLPWIVLRPPAVYGPGDRQTLSFFRWVGRGVGPVLGSETSRVSLLYVDDLAAAVAIAADERTPGGFVGEPDDGQAGGHSWPAIMAAAAEQLGVKAQLLRVPRPMLYMCGVANGLLRLIPGYVPTLTPDKVRELYHHDWVCDATSMLEKTAWRPRTPIDTGFAEAIDWYRRHGWL